MSKSLLKANLQKLRSSGSESFESLIASLLESATGMRFHLARSGDQQGRDGQANNMGQGSVLFECKRYKETTALNNRDLVAELVQAIKDVPSLDVWILATTRSVPSQIISELEEIALEKSVDILCLDSLDDYSGWLDCLSANFDELVINALLKAGIDTHEVNKIKAELKCIISNPAFENKYQSLINHITNPTLGWPTWRKASHEQWLGVVNNEAECRSEFGQPLQVLDLNSHSIQRAEANQSLDEWWNTWPQNHTLYVRDGEEGDGKSWSVAQWLTNKIKNDSIDFPPVIFFASKNSGPDSNIQGIAQKALERLSPTLNWGQRLNRWIDSRVDRESIPTLLVVIDGINERQTPQYWRSVIESHFNRKLNASIALICTTRTSYWSQNFQPLNLLNVKKHRLQPFNQDELNQSLALRNLKLETFPSELRPLLSKPRYLDLAVSHHKNLEKNGDFTVSRLVYEDWKDRYQRKNSITISDNDFGDFLRQLAKNTLAGNTEFNQAEIAHMLPIASDRVDAINELSSSGVMRKKGSKWILDSSRLSMGLGLLLSDDLNETGTEQKDYSEKISSWIEPHTGLEIQSEIIEYALLNSLLGNVINVELATALMHAWLRTQNPQKIDLNYPIEDRFIAYIPLCPQVYFNLAELIWSENYNNDWGQDVCLKGFIRWGTSSDSFSKSLIQPFDKWLSMVPLNGVVAKRVSGNNKDMTEEERMKLETLLGFRPSLGPVKFQEFTIEIIEDDGLLRLSRFALAVISHFKDITVFLGAIRSGILSMVVSDHLAKDNLFKWILRSTNCNLTSELKSVLPELLNSPNPTLQKTGFLLCKYSGIKELLPLLSHINKDALFQLPPWYVEELKKKPVEGLVSCTFEQFQQYCLSPNEYQYEAIGRRLSQFSTYPELELPEEIKSKISTDINFSISLDLWKSRGYTREDHLIEEAELRYARFVPEKFADLVRKVFSTANQRSTEELVELAMKLPEYFLLLDESTRDVLTAAWDSQKNKLIKIEVNGKLAESYIFHTLMYFWEFKRQFDELRNRKPEFVSLLVTETVFKSPDSDFNLEQYREESQWTNIVWYLVAKELSLLSADKLLGLLKKTEDRLNVHALMYLNQLGTESEIIQWLADTDWRWSNDQERYEQRLGSLTLFKVVNQIGLEECLSRTAPYLWGHLYFHIPSEFLLTTLEEFLTKSLEIICESDVADQVPKAILETEIDDVRLSYLRIDNSEDTSVTIIESTSVWGGTKYSQDGGFERLADHLDDEVYKKKYDSLRAVVKSAYEKGHYWLDNEFSSEYLSLVLDNNPSKALNWVKEFHNKTSNSKIYAYRTYGFYSALTEALFKDQKYHTEAVKLYWELKKYSSSIRVIIPDISLPKIDVAIFESYASDSVVQAWDAIYEACSFDAEILELVLLVKISKNPLALKWITTKLDNSLESQNSTSFCISKSITTTAFLDQEIKQNWILQNQDENYWVVDVIKNANKIIRANKNAKYWFHEFCQSTSDDMALVAFKLFLKCADRRCWTWLYSEVEGLESNNKRLLHFRLNEYQISRSIEKNEKELKKTLFGQKTENDIYPWLQ